MYQVSKTRRLILIAILAAISTILMVFPVIPLFGGFMKLDFSIVIVLIGMYLLNLKGALTILLLRSVLKVLLFNSGVSDWVGMPMNIVAMALFISIIWLFTNKEHGLRIKNYAIGAIFGTLVMTGVMAILNWVYAIPLYEKFANFSLQSVGLNLHQWIVAMVLPFNLIQGFVLAIIAGLVIFPMASYLMHQQLRFKK
ncbi:ECF transporter S component [Periweissella fabalis]|uniref:Riboflavin transporter n=1 Tax=Periweissella fabalis TaxID=1070421 RepID=A0A7X6N489_9LACO|nr:ECF transporter S component [Periweissella fabalis]MCM0599339.1 ECF transporter S component [Periweissella fabalis]NKZ23618.1 ECF transporter S component [Periweissella fabalis]